MPQQPDRTRARALQAEFAERGDPLGWFDALYREAAGDSSRVPWADRGPNPYLEAWHNRVPDGIRGRKCLVVGCGLGDDAEYMAAQGGQVTAFDLSETAIEWCRRRFPNSTATYLTANLVTPPAEWTRQFDLIFEANTLQAMPAELRVQGMERIAQFLKPGGRLLVVCRGREPDDPCEGPPWPLVRTELDAFTEFGLAEASFADVVDPRDDARRFVLEYRLLPRHH